MPHVHAGAWPHGRSLRVETSPIQASWITATRAFSEVFLGSRNGGK